MEAVIPTDSSSNTGQRHVQQLQSVESELLRTREELAGFEKTYREVTLACAMILYSKVRPRAEVASYYARLPWDGKAERSSRPHRAFVIRFMVRKGLRLSYSAGLASKVSGCQLACCWELLRLRMCVFAGPEEVHGGG